MTKKIWLLLLSLFVIFWFWVSFADIVTHGVHKVKRCVKVVNPNEVPWYKLVMWRYEFEYGYQSYKVYDVEENECLPTFWRWWSIRSDEFLYLIDENIDISTLNDLSSEEFENKLWKSFKFDKININWLSLDNLNPVLNENVTYKIVENWSGYKLKFIKRSVDVGTANTKGVPASSTMIFSIIIWIISWLLTIVIETIIIFLMAKLFRKKDKISNWRLFLIWILASTITLPLLRFVVPLFIGYGVKYIIVWELLVTFIEVFILKYWLKISWWKAILASILCNLCSFVIWEVINFFVLPF